MLNLSHLLYSLSNSHGSVFNDRIEPTKAQRERLADAKRKIMDHLLERIAEASEKILNSPKKIVPRFRTQGSWTYKTCLQPAHLPPQEMDWDFGVYLPVSVWEGTHPKVAAKVYFDLVESALKDLCKKEGWQLLEDKENCKDTCIRVRIASWAHIDIPLYAAPEEKFKQIRETVALNAQVAKASRNDVLAADSVFDSAMFGQDWDWENLDQIMMATRCGEWKASDPAAVSRWFTIMIKQHGEQLRRVCRYLKAWRDHEWKDSGGPSSVLLMICAAQTFQRCDGRDDLALLHVITRLTDLIRGDVRELAIDEGEEDFNRLDSEERVKAAAATEKFRQHFDAAMSTRPYEKEKAILYLQRVLGNRIPDNIELIAVAAAEIVRNTPAKHVPAPQVNTTKAG